MVENAYTELKLIRIRTNNSLKTVWYSYKLSLTTDEHCFLPFTRRKFFCLLAELAYFKIRNIEAANGESREWSGWEKREPLVVVEAGENRDELISRGPNLTEQPENSRNRVPGTRFYFSEITEWDYPTDNYQTRRTRQTTNVM